MIIKLIKAGLAIAILGIFLFLVLLGYMSILLKHGDKMEEEEQNNNEQIKHS